MLLLPAFSCGVRCPLHGGFAESDFDQMRSPRRKSSSGQPLNTWFLAFYLIGQALAIRLPRSGKRGSVH